MKSKFILYSFFILAAASCNKDFLEIPPETSVTTPIFFKSEEDFIQAINGTYAVLRSLYRNAYVMGEMRSDNTHYIIKINDRGGQNVEKEQIADFLNDGNNRYGNEKWNACYSIIARANEILARIDDIQFSEASKNNIKGQAHFLRAFAYFELVQYFGDLPLHLVPVTGQADAALPKTPKAGIYDQIMKDAQTAAGFLPGKPAQEPGRVTSGSAKTLMGYVHMTLKQYVQAETVLKEVTTMGYGLLADYAAVFTLANKNSVESIFEVQYMQGTQGVQNSIIYDFLPSLTDMAQLPGAVTGNNAATGGWNTPSEDLIAAYEPNDKRKNVSIAFYNNGTQNIPYIVKYLHSHANFNNLDDNWPVYRYADVLLLLAEAANEQNKTTEALGYLNNTFGVASIRGRAGLAPVTTTNQATLRTIIEKERRLELAFENHRWLDLVRTGRAVQVMNAYGAVLKSSGNHSYLLPQSYNVTDAGLLFPIPQSQIDLNPQLK
jgi:hypothetical protein